MCIRDRVSTSSWNQTWYVISHTCRVMLKGPTVRKEGWYNALMVNSSHLSKWPHSLLGQQHPALLLYPVHRHFCYTLTRVCLKSNKFTLFTLSLIQKLHLASLTTSLLHTACRINLYVGVEFWTFSASKSGGQLVCRSSYVREYVVIANNVPDMGCKARV